MQLSKYFGFRPKTRNWRTAQKSKPISTRRLRLEPLEERSVLSVTLSPIVGPDTGSTFNVPSGKDLYVPLTGLSAGQSISYSATSSNSNVSVNVLTGNPTLQLSVQGTRTGGQTFSGTMTIELFQDQAPNTVSTIEALVNSGFYTNQSFYRIIQDFMIQGGANGTKTAPTFADEFDADLSFNSPGLLAMANPGTVDSNTSEFFITDINLPLASDPQYLNYRHSIFGQLTSGFDIYDDIMNAIGVTSTNSSPTTPVTITSATIVNDDTQNGVLHVSEANSFTGTSTITVTASSSDGTSAIRTFTVTAAPSTSPSDKQPLILRPVADQVTTTGTPISFQLTASQLAANALTFSVTGDSSFRAAPANVTAQITPGANGTATVTLTPAAGFTGAINLLAHVDDSTSNVHDVLPFTLTVNPAATTPPATIGTASLSGTVYSDANGSHKYDTPDVPLEGVMITLNGVDASNNLLATQTTTTAHDGTYHFNNLVAGTYTLTKAQSTDLTPGEGKAGTLGGTASKTLISSIVVAAGASGIGYNFSELGVSFDLTNKSLFYASSPLPAVTLNDAVMSGGVTAPIVTAMTKASTDPATTTTVAYTVNFNEAVSGVNANTFTLNATGGVTGATIASVTGSGSSYTVTINTGSGSGTLALALTDTDTVKNQSGTPLGSVGAGNGNFVAPSYTITKAVVAISTVTAPVNASNFTNTSVSGTGEPGATISLTATDGTHTTAAKTATVAAGGTWLINGIDVTLLTDGPITYTATSTNAANQTITATKTTTKDIVAPAVAVTTISTPNAANVANTTASGSGEVAATISIVATDGTHTTTAKTTTVAAGGTWSVSGIDVTTLNQGTITYTATATDAAGNTATNSKTAVKDTIAPVVSVTTVPASIGLANAADTGAGGTGEANATISVVASDGVNSTTAVTTTVAAGGAWSVTGINVSGLKDGTITYTATATDTAGNSATSSETSTKTAVAVVTISPINALLMTNISASGTGEVGATLSVVATDGTHTTTPKTGTIAGNGAWSVTGIDISTLIDGPITITATATNGNQQSASSSKTAIKDTLPPSFNFSAATSPINISKVTTASANGSGEVGATVSVTASDGVHTTAAKTTTVGSGATWLVTDIDASVLSDGPIVFTATATDAAGNAIAQTINATKDTTAPALTLVDVTNPISLANATNTTASGTGEANLTVSVVASDGTHSSPPRTTVVGANGEWTVTGIDVSALNDGTVTYTATITDAASNSVSKTLNSAKSAVAITTIANVVNLANVANLNVSGSGQAAAGVSVVVTDGTHTSTAKTATIDANGNWTVTGVDATSLVDGPITYSVTATDSSNNTATNSKSSTKDTVAPTLAIASATNATIVSEGRGSVQGTGEDNTPLVVTVTDGTHTTAAQNLNVSGAGIWSLTNVNLSSLNEGPITYSVVATDAAGNTTTKTQAAVKDTVAPAITVLSTSTPNISNVTGTSASGTAEADAAISVVATDGTHTTTAKTTTATGDGSWSVTGIDVTALNEGQITYTATATDAVGNTATHSKTATKDTVAPAVTATTATNPINLQNVTATAASGTGEVGATISVVATDGTTSTAPKTAVVGGDGNWTVDGIDVTALLDGAITYTATATDVAGNTATSSTITAKDTIITQVTILAVTNPITAANQTNATASGTGPVGVTIQVAASDPNFVHTTSVYTTTVLANGTWSVSGIDVSGLNKGPISFGALNAADNTDFSIKGATKTV